MISRLKICGCLWKRGVIAACAFGVLFGVMSHDSVTAAELRIEVVDCAVNEPLPARIYLRDEAGIYHFVRSADPLGTAVRYDKTNWINRQAREIHTTVSAHPVIADVPAGKYLLTIERGKEYVPVECEVEVEEPGLVARVSLMRWINMAKRGWYSGETHIHRTPEDLPNIQLAEDLNVAFPLTYWVTQSATPPARGDKNQAAELPEGFAKIDDTHVFWPRNTEYEIFTVGPKRHTLGALFVLNHPGTLPQGFPPVRPVAEHARSIGALLDMDKLDWPFGMTLPHSSGATLYELANNHLWRTEFGFSTWNTSAPPWLQPPLGGTGGGEREWWHYTLGMYYTLLNAGYPLVPTAGTANGVHPVPAGFSRVYVPLPEGFSYEGWLEGFRAGRSFVTTGPMLFTQVNDQHAGTVFKFDAGSTPQLHVTGEVHSEYPLAVLEVIVNGEIAQTIFPKNKPNEQDGVYVNAFRADVTVPRSGWLCVRVQEDRPDGRLRFAHTAPWRWIIPDRPLLVRAEESRYLQQRVLQEIDRSREIVDAETLAEYEAALQSYRDLPTLPEPEDQRRPASNSAQLRRWLENMVWGHRYTVDEIRAVTGLSVGEIQQALEEWQIRPETAPPQPAEAPLAALPYPGGRHPRIGFHDGALAPQRETKLSLFPPWKDGGYVVLDVPEAIWSNLGLTYLAHMHVPTLWSKAGTTLPPLEWTQTEAGDWTNSRTLPNGIRFEAIVCPRKDHYLLELSLTNGTSEPLTKLRAQVCAMLGAARGFSAQTGSNKVLRPPYAAARNLDGTRWIITGWEPLHRGWQNPPVPCLHADPEFPDCPPGETVRARGILVFSETSDLDSELQRIEGLSWRSPPNLAQPLK